VLFKERKRDTARWDPLDVERQRKYTMARKWVKMTRKQSERDALHKNIHLAEREEVPELPDAQASAKQWAKWRRQATKILEVMRRKMHKRAQEYDGGWQ
jgi:hypothetical protein